MTLTKILTFIVWLLIAVNVGWGIVEASRGLWLLALMNLAIGAFCCYGEVRYAREA